MTESDKAKLFVGGISRETNEAILTDHFSKYGSVSSTVVARDRITKIPRGFGFVLFSEPSSADEALKETHVILGRTVEVKKAIPRSEQRQERNGVWSNDVSKIQFTTKKIFVGGLSAELTEVEFRSYFSKFGKITDVVVMHDSMTNRPRGFGFVTFESEDSVENAVQKSFHELNDKLVEVKRAVPKDGNSGSRNNGNSRSAVGSRSPYDGFQPFEYPSNGPRYDVLPGFAPFPGYNGVGAYPYNGGFYGGGHPALGYGRLSFGIGPISPRAPLYPHPPMMLGGRVCTVPPYPVSGSPGYTGYMNSGVGMMSTIPGGSWIMSPRVDVKWDQIRGGNEVQPANTTEPRDGGTKSDFNSSGSKKSSGGASSIQNQSALAGKPKPLM